MIIASRYCGPPKSGNGGYTAGLLAEAAGGAGPLTVRLAVPPPLDTPLSYGKNALRDPAGLVVATIRPGSPLGSAAPPVSAEVAATASARYAGLADHPFPTCFVCGPQRAIDDGMRLFPGPVTADVVATVWRPTAAFTDATGRVPRRMLWAALDCPGAWTLSARAGRPVVLGEMTAVTADHLAPDMDYVVVGAHINSEGRRSWTATAIYHADGALVGQAEAVWFEVDPAVFT